MIRYPTRSLLITSGASTSRNARRIADMSAWICVRAVAGIASPHTPSIRASVLTSRLADSSR